MKISVITVAYQSAKTLEHTLQSVQEQNYTDIEHIVIDGGSKDGSIEILQKHGSKIRWVSEPDRGIYDAMNKGIQMATGEVIGMLNADDFYTHPEVLSRIAQEINPTSTMATIADVAFIRPDMPEKIVRKYSAANWHPGKFVRGFMPPHPSFYCKKTCYDIFGLYKTDYAIAADYELLIRFLAVEKIKYSYIPMQMVTMRTGGASTRNLKSNYILNEEIIRACKENGLYTNRLMVYGKYFRKIFELRGRLR
ncbi:MAG: glycosyltransferase [Cyclobacteriaceae bacterium]|nr:glycosyltransferase [Cyclobacteriaceae bacterium]